MRLASQMPMSPPRLLLLAPDDVHNRRLAANVHPPQWIPPPPAARYDLVVLGAGPAGLVAAAGAAALGARVALVERHLLGGDCLNYGCVPSKALLRAAHVAAEVREAGRLGIRVPNGWNADFTAAMERVRRLRAELSQHDAASRFRDLGVDVFLGHGQFASPDTVAVAGQTLRFRKAVIATGARPAVPPIPGLDQVPFLTNESVFSLTELPRRIGILGAGPIGCELAQALARFGAEVILLETAHGILPREERDAAEIVGQALARDGVRLWCCAQQLEVHPRGDQVLLRVASHGASHEERVDRLLVAAGRTPNVEGLNLEAAGVAYDLTSGVRVDDHLRTTNRRIFAAGDVCAAYKFTHAADAAARLVLRNALFYGRAKVSRLVIPWCTYTSPEIAHVGLYPGQAEARGIALDTYTQPLAEVDRAVLDGQAEGFVRIHTRRGTDRIVGATIVAAHAGELIAQIALAMTHGLGLKRLAGTIYPYPTQAEAIRKVGDRYQRSRLTPLVRALFQRWFTWTR